MSPSKAGRGRRSRSTSKSRSNNRSSKRHERRSRSRDKKEEKERQRKGFGVMKRECLSVCSTTLWVGHLSKLVSQEELSDTFGSYGDIVSIDMIQSRGCAFVVMNRRQDACRALERLKSTKLQGKTITVSSISIFFHSNIPYYYDCKLIF
jgi:RNA recognition motif-containing protein